MIHKSSSMFPVRKIIKNYLFHQVNRSCQTSNNADNLVYSFSYARVGSLVNKIKLRQSVITGLLIPISGILELQAFVPPGSTALCTYISVSSNIAFYSVGQLFYKLIGKVYLNDVTKNVRFSYVGFFGKRVDVDIPKADVISPGDASAGMLYTKIEFNNRNLTLKLQEKYFDYCDINLGRKVFGESFQRL